MFSVATGIWLYALVRSILENIHVLFSTDAVMDTRDWVAIKDGWGIAFPIINAYSEIHGFRTRCSHQSIQSSWWLHFSNACIALIVGHLQVYLSSIAFDARACTTLANLDLTFTLLYNLSVNKKFNLIYNRHLVCIFSDFCFTSRNQVSYLMCSIWVHTLR